MSDRNNYDVNLKDLFAEAANQYTGISIDPEIMSGAPCIKGTRIPVFCILSGIAMGGLYKVIESYPHLTGEQIIEAINFAKYVIECPLA